MNWAVFVLIGIMAISIIGCTGTFTGRAIRQTIPTEINQPLEVYFCPTDNCTKAITDQLNIAKNSIHCAFYDLNLKEVIKALSKKSQSVDVKVVIDNDNNKGHLKGNGIRFDNNKQLMHNKFCIIDSSMVVTGSFNPTEKDSYKNNNNLLIIHSSLLAANYEAEFQELWEGTFGNGNETSNPIILLNKRKVQNYFCPEDHCQAHVIEELKKAKESIYFMAFSFTDEAIADAILFSNVEIKGIFEKFQANGKDAQYHRLRDFGIDVILDKNKYFLHHKVFIIDNSTVIAGSFNPTKAGSFRNDENILIIEDKGIAQKFLNEFDYLYAQDG